MLNLLNNMEAGILHESVRRFEVPGRIAFDAGGTGLPKINVTTELSAAEIYLHGAHVGAFRKNDEPPLLFMSTKSHFAAGEPIRGGVPICFPWFGPRTGGPAHGFARVAEWQLINAAATANAAALKFALPQNPGREAWKSLRTEFIVEISDVLMMELSTTNESCEGTMEIENCLHTYFHVGDIEAVSIAGLQGLPFDDFAFGASGARRSAEDSVLRITEETNRVYPDAATTVEIRDEKICRTIRVEKFNSQSTVVWNPCTTQKLPDDFDPTEYKRMVCVESGNVK